MFRFPKFSEVVQVYAVNAFIVNAWVLMWIFWKVPSWMFYLSIGEILALLCYILATAFLEGLLLGAGVTTVGFILPARWFRDRFVVRGVLVSLFGIAYLIFFALHVREGEIPDYLVEWLPYIILASFVLTYLLERISLLEKIIGGFSERLTVFLYFSVPAGVLSLLVVLIRNLGVW
jgi:hypothetical protein